MANPFGLPMAGRSLRNLLSRPATRSYPAQPHTYCQGSRGHIEVEIQSCVFCGLCARRCPSQAITVSREEKRLTLEHLRCVGCAVCVDVCNKSSLSLAGGPVAVQTSAQGGAAGLTPRGREEWVKKETPAAPVAAGS